MSNKKRAVVPYQQKHLHVALGIAGVLGAVAIAVLVWICVKKRWDAIPAWWTLAMIPTAVGGIALYLAIMKPRLVLGSDYLELRVGPGKGTVRGQIPIANIASAEIFKRVTIVRGNHVGPDEIITFEVHLLPVRARDDETWWPGFQGKKSERIEIRDEYVRPPSWIKGRISTLVGQRREVIRSKRRDE